MNLKTGALLLLVGSMGLLGCQMKADITDESRRSHITCTDTRDGEKFSFRGATVRDAVQGFGTAHCFTVTDDTGMVRRLCSSQEVYLKCKPNALVKGAHDELKQRAEP